jgi:hypothetical protein
LDRIRAGVLLGQYCSGYMFHGVAGIMLLANIVILYSGSPGFKYRSGNRLSIPRDFVVSSVTPDKYGDIILHTPLPLSSASFQSHNSLTTPSFAAIESE